ncbi:MAG: DUF1329 domain-containing protein [Deltaproteobacteria bacterium]|nr:DUF1329 domain-containing protein [Deltaproteobacteria bacterium]
MIEVQPSRRSRAKRAAQPLRIGLAALAVVSAFGAPAGDAEDDATTQPALREGEVIGFEQVDRLRPYLPVELWPHKDFFFYEGMQLEIGPAFRDYSPAAVYQEATTRNRGKSSIGPDGSLEGYVAGQPFPMDEIDCQGDPQAGVKVAWDLDRRWEGAGVSGHAYYSYWDRGEELPLYYEGTARNIWLSGRPEPQYADQGGDLFRGEKRKLAYGVEVLAPYDAKGIALINYRYKSSQGPLAQARNDDTWVYVPTLRRVRRISTAQRTDAVSGTDFTFDDFGGFFGVVPQYEWQCLGRMDILAPVNSKVRAYPYAKNHNFGPYGLSMADDRWELRKAIKVRLTPRNADHPYAHKDIYVDENTSEALYSFAYDQKDELWKIIYHNKRWSEDHDRYKAWEGVPEPRDSVNVADVVINVQTGTGNRIEFWDANGTPLPAGKARQYIDVGRLTRGR